MTETWELLVSAVILVALGAMVALILFGCVLAPSVPAHDDPYDSYPWWPNQPPVPPRNPVPLLPNPYLYTPSPPGGLTPHQEKIFCRAEGQCI